MAKDECLCLFKGLLSAQASWIFVCVKKKNELSGCQSDDDEPPVGLMTVLQSCRPSGGNKNMQRTLGMPIFVKTFSYSNLLIERISNNLSNLLLLHRQDCSRPCWFAGAGDL